MHQTILIIINNLKVVDNDALSAVISQYERDIIVLTQEITARVIFCMKTLKAGKLVIDRLTEILKIIGQ